MPRLEIELKEIKGLREWARKQFPDNNYIYYKRSAKYAQCKCSECGGAYEIRTESTGDPFEDTAVDIEKPERDKATKCRACGAKAIYKPAGHTARTYSFKHIITGQKLSDDKFVFEFWYACQETQAGQKTYYGLEEERLIICERGKKAKFYTWNTILGWIPGAGIASTYYAHPSVFREIKKTGMYKYIPVPEAVKKKILRRFVDSRHLCGSGTIPGL